jgi:hypothetical protein
MLGFLQTAAISKDVVVVVMEEEEEEAERQTADGVMPRYFFADPFMCVFMITNIQ